MYLKKNRIVIPKLIAFSVCLLMFAGAGMPVFAQTPEESMDQAQLQQLLEFLASDELRGRRTGEPGNNRAADFIANYFDEVGLRIFQKAPGYLQTIPFVQMQPAKDGEVRILNTTFSQGDNLVVLAGGALERVETEAVVAGYGIVDPQNGVDDYAGLDVEGKVVVVRYGTYEGNNPMIAMAAGSNKAALAEAKGALALVEIYAGTFPWERAMRFMNRSRLTADPGGDFPYFLVKPDENLFDRLAGSEKISVQSSGVTKEPTPSSNVVGWVEGTDPDLNDEFVILSAHFDHVGVGEPRPEAPADSIYNGTRDNAMGTVAVMAAAKALAQSAPARSVIFLALTGEEVGLLGSSFYAANPLVALDKTVFNLNIDGAGYTDTTIVTVVGLERTTAQDPITKAVADFGLEAISDPVPEQNLFNRSDNVNFARKGIPAPTFSLGFRAFDAEIMKYYHQPADETESVDYDYFLKYCQAYARAARYVADMQQAPFWVAGDPYEAVGQELYGKD